MSKTRSEVQQLFKTFQAEGMEAAVGISVDDHIAELEEKSEELKEERHAKFRKTGEMDLSDSDESRLNIQISIAETFKEKMEYGEVNFNDFVEYLHLCEVVEVDRDVVSEEI